MPADHGSENPVANVSTRRSNEPEDSMGIAPAARRGLALLLIATAVFAAYNVLSRDVDWETRGSEARQRGLTAEGNGNYELARRHYESALANHPYDWETHLFLAKVLNYHLNDYDAALRHYYRALAYSPDPSINEETQTAIDILRRIRSGELENPLDALEDMFFCVDAGTKRLFSRRLSIPLREELDAYWAAWNRRGPGKVTYCRVTAGRDGFYDAMVELDFDNDTSMSMRFMCPSKDIWRLELSFP